MKRILAAGLLGGIAVFVWGMVSHMVLGLGSIGIQRLPNETAIVEAMRANITAPGLYFFPGIDMVSKKSKAEQAADEKAWGDAIRRGPSGLLVIDTRGKEPLMTRTFAIELLTNIFGAAIAAMLLTLAASSLTTYWVRVLFVAALGLFASIAIDLSYWNWYGFPAEYTIAALVDQTLSWFVGGLVLARLIRP
jgi:hypothetical protein